jgi:phosphoribosyl-ATP pyrophosphohydrolase
MNTERLYQIIEERKNSMSENSYVASLNKEGLSKIAQKVGEEAIEVIIAAKDKNEEEVVKEVADLWFHTLVLLSNLNIDPSKVFDELERRHEEKERLSKSTFKASSL